MDLPISELSRKMDLFIAGGSLSVKSDKKTTNEAGF